jgi:hypothetical protein
MKQAKYLLVSALLHTMAQAGSPPPPATITRASHSEWLRQLGAQPSPYSDFGFRWLEEQKAKPLPAQVTEDPEKLYVPLGGVLAEAIRAETAGDVDEGTTYGLESYALLDAPISAVLETILFRWGKPVGAESGITYPNDTVFSYREERLSPEWGPGTYKTYTTKRNGGVASDLSDSFTLLVRGGPKEGYLVAGDFLSPMGATTTTSSLTLIWIRPIDEGKTDYRIVGFQTGQSYSFFGLDIGRRTFGFNPTRVRDGQKDFLSQVAALKATGKIPERR